VSVARKSPAPNQSQETIINGSTFFDLVSVFSTVADGVPDQDMLVWRERRLTFGEVDRRIDAVAAYLRTAGLGCHTERQHLARHESGQDHLGIYLRNGTEYLAFKQRRSLKPFGGE
jgi:3-oxocholest-4-en-26-oate---CoA ligase